MTAHKILVKELRSAAIALAGVIALAFWCCGGSSWDTANKRWNDFSKKWLEAARMAEARTPRGHAPDYRFDHTWLELQSQLLVKYLPQYRAFTDRHQSFLLRQDGDIILLSLGKAPDICGPIGCHVNDFSTVIAALDLSGTDPQCALDIVHLYEILTSNGNGNPDGWPPAEWKPKASMERASWLVSYEYTGPPAQIMVPPSYRMVLGPGHKVIELRSRTVELTHKTTDGQGWTSDIQEQRL